MGFSLNPLSVMEATQSTPTQTFRIDDIDIVVGVHKGTTGELIPTTDKNGVLVENFQQDELRVRIEWLDTEGRSILTPVIADRKVQDAGFRKDVTGQPYTEFEVPLNRTGDGDLYSTYPTNSRRIVSIPEDGRVRVYQLSLVGQYDHFALDLRHAYEFQMYNVSGHIRLAGDTPSWENTKELVVPFVDLDKLPTDPNQVSEIIGRDPIEVPDAYYIKDEDYTLGVVEHFQAGRGTGIIQTAAGPLKVYFKQAPMRENGLRLLYRGENVKIGAIGDAPKESSLDHSALEVELIKQDESA